MANGKMEYGSAAVRAPRRQTELHANTRTMPLFPVQSRGKWPPPSKKSAAGGKRFPPRTGQCRLPRLSRTLHLTRPLFILAIGGVWPYCPVRRWWYWPIVPYTGVGAAHACAALAAALQHGRRALWWSSPLALLSCCRRSSLSRIFPSLTAPCGARERRARSDRRRARDARGARTSRVVLTAEVEQERSRAVVVFSSSSSLVLSPVVVLVSRLLFGRRSVRSEGDARGARRATRGRRAQRACIAGG